MFEFGRELKKMLSARSAAGESATTLLELLDPALIAGQARAADVEAGRVSCAEPFPVWMAACVLWREQARRTGDVIALRRSAAAAQSATREAKSPIEAARAALEHGLTSLVGVDLFGDLTMLDAAEAKFRQAAGGAGDALFEARLEAAWARLASRQALARDQYDRALESAALFDAAIHRLAVTAEVKASWQARLEAANARLERADLMSGFGLRRQEPRLIEDVCADLSALLAGLNPDREPLTWARAVELKGAALAALGEMTGTPERIAEGVTALVIAGESMLREHSPLDWARVRHSLAVALQGLGEACDSDRAFEEAERAFAEAAQVIGEAPLALRATLANNRAACMALAAERRGDLAALGAAETAFKRELAATSARHDPVTWAILQVNLARIYESRASLLGAFPQREAAVYALEEAFEEFCGLGLKSLAETTAAALERVRAVS